MTDILLIRVDPPGGDEGRQVRLPPRLPPQVPQHRHPRHPRQRGRGPLRRGDRGARHQVKQDVIIDVCGAELFVFGYLSGVPQYWLHFVFCYFDVFYSTKI